MKVASVTKPGAAPPVGRGGSVGPPAPVADDRLVTGRQDGALGGTGVLETIIGTDERTQIVNTGDAPWRMICALAIESPLGSFVGTGWFAGPRTIITAGHVVWDDAQMGDWATSITVTPGQSDATAPFGSIVATRFSTLTPWLKARDADYDVGVIHLDKVAGDPGPGTKTGWFGVTALADADLMKALVNISGYPADKGGNEQWWAKNRVKAVTPRRVLYDVDTVGGQSGAPVFVLDASGRPQVVGIHAYGTGGTPTTIPMEVNSAPRIIPEIAEAIAKWIAADA